MKTQLDTFGTVEIKTGKSKRTIQTWCKALKIKPKYETRNGKVVTVFYKSDVEKLLSYVPRKPGRPRENEK